MGEQPGRGREPSPHHTKITDWPADERPREKLKNHGAHTLSDAEVLAILIRAGIGGMTAVDVARSLLQRFGSLEDLACRPLQELRQFHGLGETKSILLVAAFELGRRDSSTGHAEKVQFRSPEEVVRRFQPLMRDLKQEVFKVLLLDSANHLLRDVNISEGILNSSLVHPREVFRQAILEPAAGVIVIHNHPSGNAEPSAEDIQITRQLVEAGKIVGIPVHDHIIVTSSCYTSFSERGLL